MPRFPGLAWMAEIWSEDRFGIYIHWPFCQSICPYCAFNRRLHEAVDDNAWRDAYIDQIASSFSELGRRKCASVYFGGGTPSLMPPQTVESIIEAVSGACDLAPDAEITLEANPTSSEARKFRDFRLAGVNRVSIGMQSLSDAGLAALGRTHDAAQARFAHDAARAVFENVSVDLMFGRQRQTPAQWELELQQALGWGAPHMSLYQLTIEPDTAFARRLERQRLPGIPDEDSLADMHRIADALCADAGYRHYEVSNFCRPGFEARHNLLYWRSRDWLGLGPGAHGRIELDGSRFATLATSSTTEWLALVQATGCGEQERRSLDSEEVALEYLLMSLRLEEGMSHGRYLSLGGHRIDPRLIAELVEDGLVLCREGRICATSHGRMLLNTVVGLLANRQTAFPNVDGLNP